MLFGYNTNGLAHHDPAAAVGMLAEFGYKAVGITLDHHWLNPFESDWKSDVARWKKWLERFGMRSAIETGSRFLLDSRQKHEPTLVSSDASGRTFRVQFYQRAIDTAAELGSDCVSLWSGCVRDPVQLDAGPREAIWDRLCTGLSEVLDHAAKRNVAIGFEPEPGMFVATLKDFTELQKRITHPHLKLTIDVGHLHCEGELPIANKIVEHRESLVNVHIEDMRVGVHEHLLFGEGEIDFVPVLAALQKIEYANGVYVELSRHSHCAPEAASHAIQFLNDKSKQIQ